MSVIVEYKNLDDEKTMPWPYNGATTIIPSQGQFIVSPFNQEKIAVVNNVAGDPGTGLVISISEC